MIQIDGITRRKISPDSAGYVGWHFEVGGDTMGEGVTWTEQVAYNLLVTNWRTQNVWLKLGILQDFSVGPFLGTGGCMVIIILLWHSGMFPMVAFVLVWALNAAAILWNDIYFMKRDSWEAIGMTNWRPWPMANRISERRKFFQPTGSHPVRIFEIVKPLECFMVSYDRKLPPQQVVTELFVKIYDGKEFATSCWIICLRLRKCFESVTDSFFHTILYLCEDSSHCKLICIGVKNKRLSETRKGQKRGWR